MVTSLNKSEQKGWIYFRMIRCLYITYVEKIGKDFVSRDFVEAVRAVGKLAWQTLLSGNPMFRKKELGLEVFAYGLLIGDEDPKGLSDETADILVTFAHQSIQEFFGAFYVILSLSEGETIDSLLGGDRKKPIFLTNPLFLEFCLWLLNTTDLTSFPWEKETVQEILATYLVDKIDNKYLNLKDLRHESPALYMTTGSHLGRDLLPKNRMVVDLMKDILSRCSKIEYLALPISVPIDELLSAVNPHLWESQIHTLFLFEQFSLAFERTQLSEREIKVEMIDLTKPWKVLPAALKYCYRAERRPCIHLAVADDHSLGLSDLFQINDIRQLHVNCIRGHVSCNQDIPHCSSSQTAFCETLEER